MEEKQYFEIENSDISLKALCDQKPQMNFMGAGVLILPSDLGHNAFYSGTVELYNYFKNNSPPGVVDIYAQDEEYKELAQYSADHWIGTFFVVNAFVPLLVNLLSNYVFEKLRAQPEDTISVNVVVERQDGKSSSVNFRGNARDFPQVIESVKRLADD